jgi:ABC-type nitrate/sulfonate/bicarbonate transport system substrate-binding protein
MCTGDGRRWRVCLLVGLMVLAGSLVVGCGGDDDEPTGGGSSSAGKTTKVRVGMLPISNAAPLYLGIKQGFFKEEGLELEPVMAQSGNEIVTALVGGDFRFGFIGFVPGMAAVSKGLPLKIIASGDTGAETEDKEWTQIVVGKDSAIRDVKDLAGKTIALNALKGVGEVVVKAALEKRGVDPASIKLLEVPFPGSSEVRRRGLEPPRDLHPTRPSTSQSACTMLPQSANGALLCPVVSGPDASDGLDVLKLVPTAMPGEVDR